jgi:hypothetical protein
MYPETTIIKDKNLVPATVREFLKGKFMAVVMCLGEDICIELKSWICPQKHT